MRKSTGLPLTFMALLSVAVRRRNKPTWMRSANGHARHDQNFTAPGFSEFLHLQGAS